MPAGAFQPAYLQSVPLAPGGLTLAGHTVQGVGDGGSIAPGALLVVDLVLEGGEQFAETVLEWSLRPADQPEFEPVVLWSGPLAPRVDWGAGEVLCRRLKANLPADLPPGRYLLHLATTDYDQPFGEVVVGQ
jgi:hypothetical protein